MDLRSAVTYVVVLVCLSCSLVNGQVCRGLGTNEFVHGLNINDFAGCKIIDGDFRILESTFNGDAYQNLPAVEPSQLYLLETVEDIYGHLVIQGEHPEFDNLDFFRNLKRIHGQTQSYVGAALQIYGTSLKSLELKSLELIKDGIVVVGHNDQLCFADNVNWGSLFTPGSDQRTSIKFNKQFSQCQDDGQLCDPECSLDGCWGKGNRNCLHCDNYEYEGQCVRSCYTSQGLYAADSRTCARCDTQCSSCSGPGASQCTDCTNYKFGDTCVDMCPEYDYAAQRYVYAEYDSTCQFCDEQCDGGCSGKGSRNCFKCRNVQIGTDCVESCPIGTYADEGNECQFCADQCDGGCIGPGASACLSCKSFTNDDVCVDNCPYGTYPDANMSCHGCNPQCDGRCSGPSSTQCYACRNVKDDGVCVDECPGSKYPDSNRDCQACDEECLYGCYNDGPYQCIACTNYEDDGRCVVECPAGKCPDTDNKCGECESMMTYQQLVERVTDLQFQAAQIQNRIESAVVFTAYSSPERVDHHAGDLLRFDGIITNIGGGYSPEKSVFVCPRSGLYLFAVSVDNYMRGSLIPSIYRGRELVASAGAYNSASQTVIITCEKGQEVAIKTSQGGTMFNMYGWKTSTFTGYLLANGEL